MVREEDPALQGRGHSLDELGQRDTLRQRVVGDPVDDGALADLGLRPAEQVRRAGQVDDEPSSGTKPTERMWSVRGSRPVVSMSMASSRRSSATVRGPGSGVAR